MWHLSHMRRKDATSDQGFAPKPQADLATVLDQRAAEANQIKIREALFTNRLSGRCVEVGCGSGGVARHLYELNRDNGLEEFLAVDPNADLVAHAAEQRGRKRSAEEMALGERAATLRFEVGWLGTLEPDAAAGDEIDTAPNLLEQAMYQSYFDHVLLVTTLSHIDTASYEAVLAQAKGLLKPETGVLHVLDNDLTNRKVCGSDEDLLVRCYKRYVTATFSEYEEKAKFFFGWPAQSGSPARSKLHTLLTEESVGFSEVADIRRVEAEYTSVGSFGYNNLLTACGKCSAEKEEEEAMRKLAEARAQAGELRLVFGYGYVTARR